MRALTILDPGGGEPLAVRDVAAPAPSAGEVLVQVRAAGLNRADLLQSAGHYPAPPDAPADIPGLEFAGEIVRLGAGVREWALGDRVFGVVAGGAQAELLVTHARTLARVPERLGWTEAAAVPEAFVTAYDALVDQAELRPGELVLIHAVASGVGLAAVQLARAMGALPFGTSRSPDKLAAARALGMVDGVALADGLTPLADAVSGWTGGRGVDVVLDLVGGDYLPASLEMLATRGRLMLVGSLAGRSATVDLSTLLRRRLTVRGTVLRARPLEEKIMVARHFAAHVVPLLAAGTVHPVVDAVFPLEAAAEAYARLASNRVVGKVVLSMG